MLYQSTRSDRRVSDTAAILEGIAPDSGLYINLNGEGSYTNCTWGHFAGKSTQTVHVDGHVGSYARSYMIGAVHSGTPWSVHKAGIFYYRCYDDNR